ncbi:MAG: MBL fold metallo-hydrolase [Thermoleophilia bacterium]|nr:MBL fold metallo-hydrolase [Thermoleophilia bacterium]
MFFKRIVSEGLAHYSYMIGDGGEALVIDPRRDCDIYIEEAQNQGVRLTHVLETHRHEDFLTGSAVLARLAGATAWHADSQWEYGYGEAVREGQSWQLGPHTLEAILTPGHTPGSMCYLLRYDGGMPWMLFSGDTLFAGEAGRVDLMGPEKRTEMAGLLYESLYEKVLPVGDGVLLFPAHGAGSACGSDIAAREFTTIDLERRLNRRLAYADRNQFIEKMAAAMELPPYFSRMEKLILEGPGPMPAPPPPLEADAFSAELARNEAIVFDVREELGFNAAHIRDSLFTRHSSISSYGGWLLPYDRPLLLVADEEHVAGAARQLGRMGYDNLLGWLIRGMYAWHNSGRDSASTAMVTVPELCRRLDTKEELCILDVRGEDELEAKGRIPGATNIHVTLLPGRLDEVPDCPSLFIFCGTGHRSTISASLIERSGRRGRTAVVLGGFAGWSSAECPIDRS